MYQSGTFSRANTLGAIDRRGSADNVLTYAKQLPAPVPPSRPSRMTKRSLPLVSEHSSPYPTFSRTLSQSAFPSSPNSLETMICQPQELQQPNAKYLTGSTPNISLYNRMEDDVYTGYRGPFWNRPSQKFDFNSLKRGSDPCITPPPPSQFGISSNQKTLKLSRSQLPTPPKPGDIPKSQSPPQGEIPKPERSQSQPLMSRSQQGITPVDKSFHQDTYSTAFALTSLGAGSKSSDYLTRVRAMWDDRHQQQCPKFGPASEKSYKGAVANETNSKGIESSDSILESDTTPKRDSDTVRSFPGVPSQTSPVLDSMAKTFRESRQSSPLPGHRAG